MLRPTLSFQPNVIPCECLVTPPRAQLSHPSAFSPLFTLKLGFCLLCLTSLTPLPHPPICTSPITLFPVSLPGHPGSFASSEAGASPEFWVAPACCPLSLSFTT